MSLRIKSALATIGLVLMCATSAFASPHHGWLKVKPINKDGRAGFQLKLRVVPEGSPTCHLSLGRMSANGLIRDRRLLAIDESKGYVRAKIAVYKNLSRTPFEATIEVLYGDNNDLSPGDQVDVLSAWPTNGAIHVHGMLDGPSVHGDTASVITLP